MRQAIVGNFGGFFIYTRFFLSVTYDQVIMKMHRFIMSYDQLEKGQTLIINDPRVVHQATRVLRFTVGGVLVICNGQNQEATVCIRSMDRKEIRVRVDAIRNVKHNLKETTLYCSVIKKDNFELVVQKATEVGVSKITPITTSRVVKLGLRYDRLQNIALEAAEQSGRSRVTEIAEVISFEEAVQEAKEKKQQNIIFDGSGQAFKDSDVYLDKIGFFIGPEGGFSEEEVFLGKKNDFTILSLGPLTLRAETAAIVASYIISNS